VSSVNKVTFIGNLGRDPEVSYTAGGKTVCKLAIATSETWKDQQGQPQEKTEWHNCVMFDRLAEVAGQYLQKGSQVYLEGKSTTNKWQDKDGNDRYSTQFVIREMKMLGSKADSQGQKGASGGYKPTPTGNPTPHNGNQGHQGGVNAQQPNPKATIMSEPDFSFDDDIPFAPIWKQYPDILYCM
jgi:single-strand DNA-binding protein